MSAEFELFPDISDEAELEAKRRRHRDDIINVMRRSEGRRILGFIIRTAGLWQESYIPGGDRQLTEFREGRRQVALMIYRDLQEHCPDLLQTMLREMNDGEF